MGYFVPVHQSWQGNMGVIPKGKEVKGKVNKSVYITLESLAMGNHQ